MRHNSDRLENHRKRATHFHDLWRNFFMGIIEGGYNSVAILVAIRHFQASDTAKSLIAGGSAVGFLLAPTILIIIGRTSLVVSQMCAIFSRFVSSSKYRTRLGIHPITCLNRHPCGTGSIFDGTCVCKELL